MTAQSPSQLPGARETYEAYLKGEITAGEVERRAREWYAANRGPATTPPSEG